MKILFYLRKRSEDIASILLRYNYGAYIFKDGKKKYKPFEYVLPFDVNPKFWLKKKQRCKESYAYAEGVEINAYIDKLDSTMRQYVSETRFAGNVINEQELKSIALKTFGLQSDKELIFFGDVIERLIKDSESGKRLTAQGNVIKASSIKKYRVALMHLESYEKTAGRVQVKQVNKSLAESIHVYFNKKNLAQNTKATHFTVYRTALNYALDKKLTKDKSFKEVRVPEVLTDTIALTQKEVDKIYNLQLSDPKLELHRDIFIVGIWSMLRFSDYSQLEEINIVEDGAMLKLISQKTKRPVYLPLHWQLREVFEKYDNSLPRLTNVQTFNRSLKELAKRAGLTGYVEIREFKGGVVTRKIVQRYQLVSSHTARRTGATLLYLAGIDRKRLMPLTDHTTDEHFDRYIRIEKYANAKALSSHDIFKRKTK